MGRYEVSSRATGAVQVEAGNWLTALGEGLAALGSLDGLDRLACEVLPNGHVLARDVRSGQGFIVQTAREAPPELAATVDDPDIEAEAAALDPAERAAAEAELDATVEAEISDEPAAMARSQEDTAPHVAIEIEDPTEEVTAEALAAGDAALLAGIQAIKGAPTPLFAWHEALDAAHRICPAESGAALELERDGRLRFVYARGPRAAEVQGAVMPASEGIAGFAVSRIASMLVHDTGSDPRFLADFDQVTGYATQAVMCVPVAIERRVYGALELLNPTGQPRFERSQLEVVELLADALAAHLADEGGWARR